MARQITVDIVGDASKFSKATDQAVTKAEGLSGKLKTAAKGFTIGAGIGAFNLLGDAVDLAASKLTEATQAFRDDQASQVLLATSLKNNIPNWDGNTQAVEDYASAQAKLGFADDEVRASLGQLVGVTHDLAEAQKLNNLAMDIARAKGIDLATATDLVTKAHEGNGKGLKALGIDLGDAKTATELLDAAQKNVEGSAAAWADTNEGKLAQSNVKVGEAMEKVGGIVDQIGQVVMPIFADALTTVVDVFGEVWTAIQPVVDVLVKELTPVFNQAMEFVKSTVIPILRQLAAVYFPAVARVLTFLAKVFGSVFEQVAGYVKGAADVIVPIVSTLVGVFMTISDAITSVQNTVGTAIGNVIGFFGGIAGKIARATSGMFDGIWSAFRGVINSIIRGWNSLSFSVPDIDLGPLGHVGGFTLNVPNIPYLHTGGVVPGAPGTDVLAMLQAGERVLPAGSAAQTINVYIDSFIGSDRDIDRFANKVALRLRTTT